MRSPPTGPAPRLPRTTLLELAKAAGKATGLVTTSQVTDASPAAFGSHVLNRDEQSEIARQYIEVTKPDVILGGGEDFWYPAGNARRLARPPADRPDRGRARAIKRQPRRAARKSLGYSYVSDARRAAPARAGRKLLGLFANEEMFEHREEGDGDLYEPAVPLPEMAAKALDVLSRDRDGFFVLIEEEAHRRDGPREQRRA